MRRFVLLALPLAVAGCGTVGNPFAGFGNLMGDTFSFHSNPNKPGGDAENMRRVEGQGAEAEPLLPEAGNVWPGPLPPPKTLSEIEREETLGAPPEGQPMPGQPAPGVRQPRGSSTPPAPSPIPPLGSPSSGSTPTPPSPTPAYAVPAQRGRVIVTPSGPATTNIGGNGVETYTLPSGGTGIVMPNPNGSLTLIGPDGSTTSVPAPK